MYHPPRASRPGLPITASRRPADQRRLRLRGRASGHRRAVARRWNTGGARLPACPGEGGPRGVGPPGSDCAGRRHGGGDRCRDAGETGRRCRCRRHARSTVWPHPRRADRCCASHQERPAVRRRLHAGDVPRA